jgi:hypothetical protein
MLNQKINLYQARFRKKRVVLSAVQMAVTGLVLLAVLGTASFWYRDQLDLSKRQSLIAQEEKQLHTEKMQALRLKLDALLAKNEVDDEIVKVSKVIAVRKHMIEFVEHNQFGSGRGFSSNLGELSEVVIRDVWLNEIVLAENFMKLSGSALKAEKVPEFFSLLRSRELFKGQVFDIFHVDRQQSRDWKVDFVIASSEE